MPLGNKPLTVPMLTEFYVATWRYLAAVSFEKFEVFMQRCSKCANESVCLTLVFRLQSKCAYCGSHWVPYSIIYFLLISATFIFFAPISGGRNLLSTDRYLATATWRPLYRSKLRPPDNKWRSPDNKWRSPDISCDKNKSGGNKWIKIL